MSMYSMLFGKNPNAEKILETLSLTEADFKRFRDVALTENDKGYTVAVYARLGGGNRPYHEEVFSKMREHPQYVDDEDDEFDGTYCTFYFQVLRPEVR